MLKANAVAPRPHLIRLQQCKCMIAELSTSSTNFSARELARFEQEVLNALPEDLVSTGAVRELRVDPGKGTVAFTILMGSRGSDSVRNIERRCRKALSARGSLAPKWIKVPPEINIRDNSKRIRETRVAGEQGLEGVRKILAVSSGKGGVGKSTVAVNLACALAATPLKVGLLDADVYGPSIPTMMVPVGQEWSVSKSADSQMIFPVNLHGIRCMSFGFVAPGTRGHGKGSRSVVEASSLASSSSSAAVMRGPVVSKVVTQLAKQTDWGELDVLVIDMPPGTSDIHITLGQQLQIDGAVIVTTPQKLSFVDVLKGLEMFDKMKVPTIAIVENMAWFKGDDGKKYFPFGKGYKQELAQSLGIKNAVSMPILAETSHAGDDGIPFFLNNFTSEVNEVLDLYHTLASQIWADLEQSRALEIKSSIIYDEKANLLKVRFIDDNDAKEVEIKPIELRKKLRHVDEMLGTKEEDLNEETLRPRLVEKIGNYAITITWSDGHSASIYSFEDIRKAFGN